MCNEPISLPEMQLVIDAFPASEVPEVIMQRLRDKFKRKKDLNVVLISADDKRGVWKYTDMEWSPKYGRKFVNGTIKRWDVNYGLQSDYVYKCLLHLFMCSCLKSAEIGGVPISIYSPDIQHILLNTDMCLYYEPRTEESNNLISEILGKLNIDAKGNLNSILKGVEEITGNMVHLIPMMGGPEDWVVAFEKLRGILSSTIDSGKLKCTMFVSMPRR